MSKPTVSIKATTWTRECHNLFDNEAPAEKLVEALYDYDVSALQKYPVALSRQGTRVTHQSNAPEVLAQKKSSEHLVRITAKHDNVVVEPTKVRDESGTSLAPCKLFRVVKDAHEIALKVGDQIKLGRAKLRVKQVVPISGTTTAESAASVANVQDILQKVSRKGFCDTSQESKEDQCKICLGYGATDEDGPLIQPCGCQGSVSHVHLECLRKWIDMKPSSGITRINGDNSYFVRPPSCELCKQPYCCAVTDTTDGTEFPLVNLPQTKAPYIVLELETGNNDEKGVYVLSLAGKDLVTLGRGHDADVVYKDVSLSRCHAKIRYDKEAGAFLLRDNGSKFGTSIRVKKQVNLKRGDELNLQLGRSMLQIKVDGA